jgi:hypothetical protein
MMNSGIIKGLIIAMIAFIFVGIGLLVGGPTMMQGFDATVNATNASSFTALQTIGKFGPGIILLGFIIMVGVTAFLGIKIGMKDK